MEIVYKCLLPGLWACWAAYWWIASRNVKASTREEDSLSRLFHVVPLLLGALLLALPDWPLTFLGAYFVTPGAWTFALGAVLLAAGLGFAIWARVALGRNWSGTVTLKQGHELVRGGPYRWVRHPIYTGLLCGVAGNALAIGQWRGAVALVIVCVALWRKLRLEERWMGEMFGAAYARYRKEVPALVPFLL